MIKFLLICLSVVVKLIFLWIFRVWLKLFWFLGCLYFSIIIFGLNLDFGIFLCINCCDFFILRRDKNFDVCLLWVVDMRLCFDILESFWWCKLGWGLLELWWLCFLMLENFGDEIEWMFGSGDMNEFVVIVCVGGVIGGGFLKVFISLVIDFVVLFFCWVVNKRI